MIYRAQESLPDKFPGPLRQMMRNSRIIFRTLLPSDPSVKAEPMIIDFEGKERPVNIIQRTYSPEQLSFLKTKSNKFLHLGFIYRNPSSKWAFAPLIILSLGPEDFRFTMAVFPVKI